MHEQVKEEERVKVWAGRGRGNPTRVPLASTTLAQFLERFSNAPPPANCPEPVRRPPRFQPPLSYGVLGTIYVLSTRTVPLATSAHHARHPLLEFDQCYGSVGQRPPPKAVG